MCLYYRHPLRKLFPSGMKHFLSVLTLLAGIVITGVATAQQNDRPNILWLTTEDMGPNLGCYGDTFAKSPNLDAFAASGQLFQRAWSNAPVCAPARTAIISGMYPPSTGSEHMRSSVPLPEGVKMYPQILRAAGYYCTNNNKEDYNLEKPEGVWDESNKKAHWKNRADTQPFFAVFNFTGTHESQNRREKRTLVSDPAKVPLPPFHPDAPEVRANWAQYYDNVMELDVWFQKHLDELKQAGLAENTIVFFYGDHGAGMPRFKRWPGSTGMRVPFIVHFPEKWKHLAPKGYASGAKSDELVSFVDLAPSLFSIIGAEVPDFIQGRAFCGSNPAPAPEFLHGFRSRMDERIDLMRSATDGRYVYIRHYMPQVAYGAPLSYQSLMQTMQVWERMAGQNKLEGVQADFWKPKPVEALYDLQSDPWETDNLAKSPEHAETLERFRKAHEAHVLKIRDLGFIPEAERLRFAGERSPRDAYADDKDYPLSAIFELASLATDTRQTDMTPFVSGMADEHPVMRYWAATGLFLRGQAAFTQAYPALKKALIDSSASVQIVAAGALASYGSETDRAEALALLLRQSTIKPAESTLADWITAVEALNMIALLGDKAASLKPELAALPTKADGVLKRLGDYVPRLISHLTAEAPTAP